MLGVVPVWQLPDCCISDFYYACLLGYIMLCVHDMLSLPRPAIQAQALFTAGLGGCDAGGNADGTNWSAVLDGSYMKLGGACSQAQEC